MGDAIDERIIDAVRTQVFDLFRLRDDLGSFYEEFGPEFGPVLNAFRGLRLMRASNPFESLVCCLCSQNSSVRQVNATANEIRRRFGMAIALEDGTVGYAFPRPEKLASMPVTRLRSIRPLAYRAKYVLTASRMISRGDLDLDGLRRTTYEEARKLIMQVPGIGPKVADCFLLYGLGMDEAAPVDRWIHRIVSRHYLRDRKVSKEGAARLLRERFGRWAGYAQLYLYHYARSKRMI